MIPDCNLNLSTFARYSSGLLASSEDRALDALGSKNDSGLIQDSLRSGIPRWADSNMIAKRKKGAKITLAVGTVGQPSLTTIGVDALEFSLEVRILKTSVK